MLSCGNSKKANQSLNILQKLLIIEEAQCTKMLIFAYIFFQYLFYEINFYNFPEALENLLHILCITFLCLIFNKLKNLRRFNCTSNYIYIYIFPEKATHHC